MTTVLECTAVHAVEDTALEDVFHLVPQKEASVALVALRHLNPVCELTAQLQIFLAHLRSKQGETTTFFSKLWDSYKENERAVSCATYVVAFFVLRSLLFYISIIVTSNKPLLQASLTALPLPQCI